MSHFGNEAPGRKQDSMLASPVASTSSHTFGHFAASSRSAKHSPAHSTGSAHSVASSKESGKSQRLADSLLTERSQGSLASPATSEGNAGRPEGEIQAMDVEEHHKVGRRLSSNSYDSSAPAGPSRRPSDPAKPSRRKSARLGNEGVSEGAAGIVNHPPADLIHLLASLLQYIARANDARRLRGSATPVATPANGLNIDPSMLDHDMTAAAKSAHGTTLTTLCFHARNVPSIAIEAYLLRILKYCPTTNEVFISLLVYFDRMARSVSAPPPSPAHETPGFPPVPDSFAGGFAIDSYNVHRLIIAGITVASKFFSDVFYTNSRYAKVGGLPLNELNQLELHFLLLNDFQLTIPVEELTEYAHNLFDWRPPPPPTSSSELPLMPHRHSDSEVSSSASTVRGEEASTPSKSEAGMVAG